MRLQPSYTCYLYIATLQFSTWYGYAHELSVFGVMFVVLVDHMKIVDEPNPCLHLIHNDSRNPIGTFIFLIDGCRETFLAVSFTSCCRGAKKHGLLSATVIQLWPTLLLFITGFPSDLLCMDLLPFLFIYSVDVMFVLCILLITKNS